MENTYFFSSKQELLEHAEHVYAEHLAAYVFAVESDSPMWLIDSYALTCIHVAEWINEIKSTITSC